MTDTLHLRIDTGHLRIDTGHLRIDTGTHSATITDMAVTDQGLAVSAGQDKRIRIWSEEAGQLTGRAIVGQVGPGAEGEILALAAHPTRGIVAVAVNSGPGPGVVVRFIDLSRDTMVAVRWSAPVADLAFSDDGSLLFVVTGNDRSADVLGDAEGNLQVFPLEDLLMLSADESSSDSLADVQFIGPKDPVGADGTVTQPRSWRSAELPSSPAHLAVCRQNDGLLRIAVTSKLKDYPQIFTLLAEGLQAVDVGRSHLPAVGREAAVAMTDRFVAFAGLDSGLSVIDLGLAEENDEPGRSLGPPDRSALDQAGGGRPADIAFSPDGRLLAVGSRAGGRSEVTVHDVSKEFVIVGRRRYDDDARVVSFLDEYTVVSAGGSRFSIESWDAEAGDSSYGIYRDGAGQVMDAVGVAGSQIGFGHPELVGLADDAETGIPSLARRFDLELLDLIPSTAADSQPVSLVDFDRAVDTTPGGDRRLEVEGGHLYLEPGGLAVTGNGRFPSSPVSSYGFLPDGSVVFGERSGTVRVLSQEQAGVSGGRTLLGHTSAVLDLAANDRWLVTAGRDQILRLWFVGDVLDPDTEVAVVEPALNLFVTATNDWIIWSPTGYYAASLRGDDYITFHHNLGEGKIANAHGAASFSKHLYRPDIIRKIVETGREDRALREVGATQVSVAEILPPHVTLLRNDGLDEDNMTYELKFEVTEAAHPTTKISIVHNGIPTDELEPLPAEAGETMQYSITVFIDEGTTNEFSVIAENDVARGTPATVAAGSVEPEAEPTTDTAFVWVVDDGQGDGEEQDTVDAIDAGDSGDEAALIVIDAVSDGPPLATVRTGEMVIRIVADPQDTDITLSAWRNDTEVWRADAGSGAGFEAEVTIPLQNGTNDIEIWADGDGRSTQLSGGSVSLPSWFNGEPVPPRADDLDGVTPEEKMISHTVRRGETLQKIARQHYGDTARYPLIFDANRSTLTDPDRIEIGMVLMVPPLPTATQGIKDPNRLGDTDNSGNTGNNTGNELSAGNGGKSGTEVDGGTKEQDEGDGEVDFEDLEVDLEDLEVDLEDQGPDLHEVSADPGPLSGGGRKGGLERINAAPVQSDPKERNLYMLSIGVSSLARTDHGLPNLRYSGHDAAAMAERFKRCQPTQFNVVHQVGVEGQNFIGGLHATKANIDNAVDDLVAMVRARAVEKKAAEKRTKQRSATDVTVLFFSGHGIGRSPRAGEPEGLYLIPYDYDENNWEATSVSVTEMADKLATLQRTELIIFIDACRSGFAGSEVVARINPQQLHKKLESASLGTIYVLSSTTRDLDSFEYRLKYPYDKTKPDRRFVGHGLFTHAILKNMDKADETGSSLTILGLGDAVQGQFATWRSWRTFVKKGMKQDPWYEFDRGFRRLEIYKR